MLKVGDAVDVEVTNVRVFGIFCRHNNDELLVLIPETSWLASCSSCEGFTRVGDKVTVKILNIDVKSGKIAATIKGRYPNPWKTDQLTVGAQHLARIVHYVEVSEYDRAGYLIELVPGAYTMLHETSTLLAPGDLVPVTVVSSNPEKLAVEVAITNRSEQSVAHGAAGRADSESERRSPRPDER